MSDDQNQYEIIYDLLNQQTLVEGVSWRRNGETAYAEMREGGELDLMTLAGQLKVFNILSGYFAANYEDGDPEQIIVQTKEGISTLNIPLSLIDVKNLEKMTEAQFALLPVFEM